MDENEKIRIYKDRLRIFLILYVFSEPYSDLNFPNLKRIFKSEQRIQKIDFLLRNPDYLSFELINIAKVDLPKQLEIKKIVKDIFGNKEPVIRRLEMERFFFGAYEDIDNVIAFLKSVDFIDFSSKKSIDLKTIEKKYFITQYAIDKFESTIKSLSALNWYVERCGLIKNYFGDLTGSQLRISQYQIEEYKNTCYREYIGGIQDNVNAEFFNLYSEKL
ncbi:hypothetical protein [Confluentibacter flavum]|uniref:Uncharacterized protein n=1 Tax=Confluentibacter flavum TaxID=1909700 RepID=A0A2N3HJJ3_9FLAO|nr:hypothetical protein [Confluentibacter flavum]PKQ45093.1 hypothetical protein CSW08_09965 [Confluentibacter flavum]